MFWWCIHTNNSYSKLKQDYELLKCNKTLVIDSLCKENVIIRETLCIYEDSLHTLNEKLLNKKDQILEIKKDTFVVSESFSESTILLKQNLLWTDL